MAASNTMDAPLGAMDDQVTIDNIQSGYKILHRAHGSQVALIIIPKFAAYVWRIGGRGRARMSRLRVIWMQDECSKAVILRHLIHWGAIDDIELEDSRESNDKENRNSNNNKDADSGTGPQSGVSVK